jgi:hypothetical protein
MQYVVVFFALATQTHTIRTSVGEIFLLKLYTVNKRPDYTIVTSPDLQGSPTDFDAVVLLAGELKKVKLEDARNQLCSYISGSQ